MAVHGRRNISILTQAPTGSTSIEAQVSSGCEPIFRLSYIRRKKINHNDTVTVADFVDDMGDKWQEFEVVHHAVADYWDVNGKCEVADLPEYFITSDKISWLGRVKMQAAMQRHIDHSISSTINLPAGTEPDLVGNIYIEAWKHGLKGVTVYVDGSRSGVLVTKDETKKDPTNEIVYQSAPKRPLELACEIHHRVIKGEKWTILIGLLEDKPYEVFAGPAEFIDIPEKFKGGTLIKNPRKSVNARYDLRYGENGSQTTVKNIVKWFEDIGDYGTLSRFVSMSLRHGVPVQYVVEQLQKDENDGMWSFNRVMARVLKKHILDGTTRDKSCPQCETDGLVYIEGCLSCKNCGYAKCG
jgi:ribonucleoside-diphosphate reductase alpha chain